MQEKVSEDFFLPFLKILTIYSRSQFAVMKRALGRKKLSEFGEDLLLSLASAVTDKEAAPRGLLRRGRGQRRAGAA